MNTLASFPASPPTHWGYKGHTLNFHVHHCAQGERACELWTAVRASKGLRSSSTSDSIMYVQMYTGKYIPYSRKYWRGIIFGGLADFLSHCQYLICQYCVNCVYSRRRRGDRTVTAKFTSANCNFFPFSSNPPNIIPTNISGYTVVHYVAKVVVEEEKRGRKPKYNTPHTNCTNPHLGAQP